jgi:hypothetical protein
MVDGSGDPGSSFGLPGTAGRQDPEERPEGGADEGGGDDGRRYQRDDGNDRIDRVHMPCPP